MINTRKSFKLTPTDKDERIEELEHKNVELSSDLEKYLSDNDKVSDYITKIEKENIELKEKYTDLEKKYFNNITDCDWCDNYCNSQLIKAKEIIREYMQFEPMIGTCSFYSEEYEKTKTKAEQFLEIEK